MFDDLEFAGSLIVIGVFVRMKPESCGVICFANVIWSWLEARVESE